MGNAAPSKKQEQRFDDYTEAFVYDKPFAWDAREIDKGTAKKQKQGVRKRMRKRAEEHPEVTQTPIKEPKTLSKVQKNVEVVAKRHDQTEEEKHEKIPKSSELNEREGGRENRKNGESSAGSEKKKVRFSAPPHERLTETPFIL